MTNDELGVLDDKVRRGKEISSKIRDLLAAREKAEKGEKFQIVYAARRDFYPLVDVTPVVVLRMIDAEIEIARKEMASI